MFFFFLLLFFVFPSKKFTFDLDSYSLPPPAEQQDSQKDEIAYGKAREGIWSFTLFLV